MKTLKHWKIRLKWMLRRLKRSLRQTDSRMQETRPTPESPKTTQPTEDSPRIVRLLYRILRALALILRVGLLIREFLRLILRNFQHSAKN